MSFLSLLFLLPQSQSAPSTTTYSCAPSELYWSSSSACIQQVTTSLPSGGTEVHNYIRPCNSATEYCSSPANECVEGEYYVPSSPSDAQGLPGDPCLISTSCVQASSQCSGGFCTGAGSGETCAADADCLPGLYCSLGTKSCVAQLKHGETCQTHSQCVMDAGCNAGQCTPFFSLADGDAADCDSPDFSNFPVGTSVDTKYSVFCASGTCSDAGVCVPPMHSVHPLPVPCTSDSDCPTTNKDLNTVNQGTVLESNSTCVQGMNDSGEEYCQADIGDTPLQQFVQWVKDTYMPAVTTPTQYCHTTYRNINQQCLLRIGGDYLLNQFLSLSQYALNYGELAAADDCTMQVYFNDYFVPYSLNQFCDTRFQCGAETSSACLEEDAGSSTINIAPCDVTTGQTCPANPFYSVNATSVTCVYSESQGAKELFPGDFCEYSSQCWSNYCGFQSSSNHGVCAGAAANEYCEADIECNPGLYCDSVENQCTALKAAGEQCSYDQQCQFTLGCNKDPQTSTGICVAYYSLSLAATVSDCGAKTVFISGVSPYLQYSSLCQSMTCRLHPQTTMGNIGECVAAYSSPSFPTNCTLQATDCPVGNEQGGSTFTQCQCGMSSNGENFCALEMADAPFQQLAAWAGQYFANATGVFQGKCHSYRRGLDRTCILQSGGQPLLMQFTELYEYAFSYPSIVHAENCTLQVYHSDYWTAALYNGRFVVDTDAAQWIAVAMGVIVVGT